jgi:hypothetical protein
MKYVNHVVTPRSITLIYNDGKVDKAVTVQHTDPDRYNAASGAIKAGKFDALLSIIRPEEATKDLKDGFSVKDGVLVYQGKALPDMLSSKAMVRIRSSLSLDPIKNFWKKALKNEAEVSRGSLVEFITKNNVTILPDGNFVLYKRVRSDMTSHHDGKTLHKIGVPLTMKRSECDQDSHTECGRGLHAAPFSWVERNYKQGLMLEVALDPEHVVSVPHADCGKIRSCWQLPIRVVGSDDDIKVSDLKEGEATTTTSSEDIPKEVRKVRAQRRKESSKGGANVIATTDRVTIPAITMLDAGFRAGDELSVFLTDKRSRFLMICPSRHLKRVLKEYKCVSSIEVKSLSSGSVSLRAPTLATAKIWPMNAEERVYKVKEVSRNLIEIRLA